MTKLILLFATAALTVACCPPETGSTRSNSAALNRNANAETFNTSGLNENAYMNASNSTLGDFKPSVGKMASEIGLWQNKEIDARLRKLMGAEYVTMKKFWNTETPMKRFGDFLMITGCERQGCTNNRYVILMHTSEGLISVVHIGKDTIKEWKEYRDIVLPPPFAEELARLKARQ